MPNTRKKVIKTVYKNEDSEEGTGDFSDSGSEAQISHQSSSDDEEFGSDYSSGSEFHQKKDNKLNSKSVTVKRKFAKTLVNKIKKQEESSDNTLTLFSVKDLTEEDKLLPSILNLSESDSSDEEAPSVSKKIIPTLANFIEENYTKSVTDVETEYKDVWSCNINNDSAEIAKKTFMELKQHQMKLEETKATISKYSSNNQEKESCVNDLLALGEEVRQYTPVKNTKKLKNKRDESDSDIEDWVEVNDSKSVVQQEGLELFVEFPDAVCRKKKQVDVEMMMKRKLNRVKKEQQVYMHKVHVLCWIGHGNYVSRVLNDQDIMAAALSLIPSKDSYPGERVDMKYLEQITKWYKDKLILKHDKNEDKFKPKAPPLKELLLQQIKQKVVTTKKYLVFIFVAMLRALGLQCRVMFNFVTLPLKPHISDLCSLSTKTVGSKDESKSSSNKIKVKKQSIKHSSGKETKPNKGLLSQLDGSADNEFDNIPQVDGSNDTSPVKTRKSTRRKSVKSKNNFSQNQDITPPKKLKINKKSEEIGAIKQEAKSSRTLRSTAGKDSKSLSDLAKTPKLSQNLSLNLRKKDENINRSVENKLTPVITDELASPRKTRSYIEKTASKLSTLVNKSNENTVEVSTQKEKTSISSPIIVTQPKVSSEYFCVKQTTGDIEIKKTRKRPHTIDTTNSDKDQQKATKLKKDPVRVPHKSKYFTDIPQTSQMKSGEQSKKRKLHEEQKAIHSNNDGMETEIKDDNADLVEIMKTRIEEAISRKRRRSKGKCNKRCGDNVKDFQIRRKRDNIYDSDDDFKPKKQSPMPVVLRNKDKRVLSSDDDIPKNKIDVWCEVFVEELEQWICVDIIKGKIFDTNSIYNAVRHPVCYVVGWDNNNYLKDLTRKYVPHWNTVTRKLRAEPEWFNKAIQIWLGPKTARDREEDEYLDQMQLEAPLPKSISEYKNHPLYALKRHLLKFEALYPPNAATLGFVRGEAVYSRDCVYVCRSREIWLKEAKVVRLGEEPYKIVKARPKWDKLSNKLITDKPLELFGPWQVQDYEPPVAENGIVPRNAYGNVELFKECMLPKGTVLIKLPGLNRVAKKLNIDCAPAVTGFDYSGGWAHPVFDGFIVCKEFEEIITDAWLKDQEEQEQRQREKLEARVYGNWRKLIKGLLIRERIKSKYGFEDPQVSTEPKNKSKPRFVAKKRN